MVRVAEHVNFEVKHIYDPGEPGISIPVVLSTGQKSVRLSAKIDTGAMYCLFTRQYGEELGLDIEAGHYLELKGINNQKFIAYGHSVSLSVYNRLNFDITAYFAKDYEITRNVLGRHGWLDRVKLLLVDYEGVLYVTRYEGGE
jgi:hypothetical protein